MSEHVWLIWPWSSVAHVVVRVAQGKYDGISWCGVRGLDPEAAGQPPGPDDRHCRRCEKTFGAVLARGDAFMRLPRAVLDTLPPPAPPAEIDAVRRVAEAAWRGEIDPDGYRIHGHLVGPKMVLKLLAAYDAAIKEPAS